MKVFIEDGAIMPQRAHETDAGLDLFSRESKTIYPQLSEVFDTGVHVEIPEHCAGIIISKSGLNVNKDITSTGLIDEGYTGSIKIKLYNNGLKMQKIEKGQKISQLVIVPVCYPDIEQVSSLDEFEETERGSGGFGSTGK